MTHLLAAMDASTNRTASPTVSRQGRVEPVRGSATGPKHSLVRSPETLLLQADKATKLWDVLRHPEPRLIHLSGRELQAELTRQVFGALPTIEERQTHAHTIRAIEDIGKHFDPLKYYSKVMRHWPLKRFREILGDEGKRALSVRPTITLTPLTVELGSPTIDFLTAHPNSSGQRTLAVVRFGDIQPPELSSRLVHFDTEVGTEALREAKRVHERAHALGYRFHEAPAVFSPRMLRNELAKLIPALDAPKVKELMRRAMEDFAEDARGEVLAHYLSGERLADAARYLDYLPRRYLFELYEYLWMVDGSVADRQALYTSCAEKFRSLRRGVQEYHYLADRLFHPRNEERAFPFAAGLLLITGIDDRHELARIVGIDPRSVWQELQDEIEAERKTGRTDLSSKFPSAAGAMTALYKDGMLRLDDLQARLDEFGPLVRGAPNAIAPSLARDLIDLGDAISEICLLSAPERKPALDGEASEQMSIILTAHMREHYPSFTKGPPIRRQAADAIATGTVDGLRDLIEMLPPRDERYWDNHVISNRVFAVLKEHHAWDLLCLFLERCGDRSVARKAIACSYEMNLGAASNETIERFRQSMVAVGKDLSFDPGEVAGQKVILWLRKSGARIRRAWGSLNILE